MVDISNISDDFKDEIRQILAVVKLVDGEPNSTARQRVSTVNSSILLISSIFEQFIREIVTECAVEIVRNAPNFASIPKSLPKSLWERSLRRLGRNKYGTDGFDAKDAQRFVENLDAFCIQENRSVGFISVVSDNDHNMRPREIDEIFARIGRNKYCSLVFGSSRFQKFFGALDYRESRILGINYLERFYITRNTIAHSIRNTSGIGINDFENYVEFFYIFSDESAKVLK